MNHPGSTLPPTAAPVAPPPPPRPLADLPHLPGWRVGLDRRLGPGGPGLAAELADALGRVLGGELVADRFGVAARAAGLKRPGVVVHLDWPRLGSRVALGIDPPLAHALVDRLLGFERSLAEARLQVSPVEWGILGFLAAQGLDWLEGREGPLGAWDLLIDRVGPDPFDVAHLGPVVTFRWRVRVGTTIGSARLWLPRSLLHPLLLEPAGGDRPATLAPTPPGAPAPLAPGPIPPPPPLPARFGDLESTWCVVAGTATIPAGASAGPLRVGKLLLIDDAPLAGAPEAPSGPVLLVPPRGCESDHAGPRFAGRLDPEARGPVVREPVAIQPPPSSPLREPAMTRPDPVPAADPTSTSAPTPPVAPDSAPPAPGALDPLWSGVAVALTVELGRVSVPLGRLAGLGPGEVVGLARDAHEPVDLRSNGRLVARGELVQVDAELGVRITQVFL